MSKESIGRDRWRQLGQANYDGFCPGCGYHPVIYDGGHRADCTVERRGWCQWCLAYYPVFGEHRSDCPATSKDGL